MNTGNYYSKKEMKIKYPEGGYLVLGEVSKRAFDNTKGKGLLVKPFGSFKRPYYINDGYLWDEDGGGFAVIKKNNLGRLLLYGLLFILLVVGLFYGIKGLLNQSNLDPNAAPFTNTIKRPANMDDSRILVPGYNDWNMVAGTDEVYVALYNPDENPCYFQFNVILDKTKEVLFETGLIPPGQAVTTVKLPRPLTEGVYPITIKINSYDLGDDSQKLNGGEVKTNIVVSAE